MLEDDEDEDDVKADPQPWSWLAFWAIMVNGFSTWFTIAGAVISSVGDLMTSHVDYNQSRQKMAEQGAKEIEALVKAVEKDRTPVG